MCLVLDHQSVFAMIYESKSDEASDILRVVSTVLNHTEQRMVLTNISKDKKVNESGTWRK